jgi:signal transduction histidine kinase
VWPVELVKSGQPVTISNLDVNLGGNRSLLAVPLFVSGEFYGCLVLYFLQERLFSQEEISLAVAFGDQVALAIENDRLRNLVKQATVIEERSRLARELHDSVTQSIYSLTLLAEGWQRMAKNGELADVTGPLAELGDIAQQALKETRLLVYELQPTSLEQEGLVGVLHQRLSAVEKRAGIEARLIAEELVSLPAPLEAGLYRIAQEALNNAIKHSGAGLVMVRLSAEKGMVSLEISDNGNGFELAETRDQGGKGLVSMRERAEQLGGTLEVLSSPGEGTRVIVRIERVEASYE